MTNKLIQSYIWHDDKCFFVSTINRESSAMYAAGSRYAETMVWECDVITHERKDTFIGQDEALEDDITMHLKVCLRLHLLGVDAFEAKEQLEKHSAL